MRALKRSDGEGAGATERGFAGGASASFAGSRRRLSCLRPRGQRRGLAGPLRNAKAEPAAKALAAVVAFL